MATYFLFSDDSGGYKGLEDYNARRNHHRFYVRGALMVEANEYLILRGALRQEIARLLPQNHAAIREVKWQHIHRAISDLRSTGQVRQNKKWSFLAHCNEQQLQGFVARVIRVVAQLQFKKVFVSASLSGKSRHENKHIITWHFHDLIQRAQMEVQPQRGVASSDQVQVISDEESTKHNISQSDISEYCFDLKVNGDGHNACYPNFSDFFPFVDSEHCSGVQIADLIAGCAHGVLKDQPFSQQLWHNSIRRLVRGYSAGVLLGRGVLPVPDRTHFGPDIQKLT